MSICEDCAMRLFNKKHHNIKGVGNPFYSRCVVVPNVDYDAYKKGDMSFSSQVEIIKSLLSSTGELDDLYIVPLIRCNEAITTGLDEMSYSKCLYHFAKDIQTYQFKDILLLGLAGTRFLHCEITDNLNNIIVSHNNIRYCINYSPLIKYKSDEKFEIFKQYLIKWYNAAKEQNFDNYNIIHV